MKVRLILLSLALRLLLASTDLPAVHTKSSFSFRRPDRALTDSLTPNPVPLINQQAISGLEPIFQAQPATHDRKLVNTQELLDKLGTLTFSKPLKFQENPPNTGHLIGYLTETTPPRPVFEIFLGQEPAKDPGQARDVLVLQNWAVKAGTENVEQLQQLFAPYRSNHRFFKRSLVREIKNDNALDTYLRDAVDEFLAFLTDPKEPVQGKPSQRVSSIEEVGAALASLVPKNTLVLTDPQRIMANGQVKAVVYVADVKRESNDQLGKLERPAFHFVVWQADPETAGVVFTGLDQEVEFAVPLRGFDAPKDPALAKIKAAFLGQDWAAKLSLPRIQGIINEKLGSCKHGQNGNDFTAKADKYPALLYRFRDKLTCFAVDASLAVVRLSSGAIQFAHLRFTCPYFHAEYIVPCVQESFGTQVNDIVVELKDVAQKVHESHTHSEGDVTISFAQVRQLVIDNLKSVTHPDVPNLPEVPKGDGDQAIVGTAFGGDVQIRIAAIGPDFKISLKWASPKDVKGGFGTEITVPKTNSYNPTDRIKEQLKRFADKKPKLIRQ